MSLRNFFSNFLAGNKQKCWTLSFHPYVWENFRLAYFWAQRPESSRPIRLIHFQIAITENTLVVIKVELVGN